VEIDRAEGGYIVEDLDDQTLVVKEDMLVALKMKLEEVRLPQWKKIKVILTIF